MTISGSTTATAGEQLVLTCTVRVVEHLISVPSVEWSGGSVGRGDGVIESNTTRDGVVIVRTLMFNPVHTFPGAQYTCMARINHQSINLVNNGNSDAHNIFVQSEYVFLSRLLP